jgi:Flp pilus assembly protein TadG
VTRRARLHRFLCERLGGRRRDERGYVLALTALVLVPMLIIAAMAIDYGGWYAEGTKMQRAADAAALAGVVWLPNTNQATLVAKETAKKNGYDDALPNITVTVNQISETELGVEIVDTASETYLAKFIRDTTTIRRSATAKYVLPVPLGSPKNYFGTGQMISGNDRENGYCSAKDQGGPFEARYWFNTPVGTTNACTKSGRQQNAEYKSSPTPAYQYYIELPPGRTQTMALYLWNPQVDSNDPTSPGSSVADTTFTLLAPDDTPFNDADNKVYGTAGSGGSCSGSGESNPRKYTTTVDNDASFWSTSGWSRFCTFTTSAPAGKYILNVRTEQNQSNSYASNAFSMLVQRGSSTTASVCDARTDSTCPSIYGKSWMSVFANASGSSGNFFLAKIGPEHVGKTVKITLFDPGEGATSVRILNPKGANQSSSGQTISSDGYATFSAQDMGTDGFTPGTVLNNLTSLDVTGGKYNGKYVELTIQLPSNYDTITAYATNGWWWKIQYNTGSSSVTDRTTWGVRVIGDPVHLTS